VRVPTEGNALPEGAKWENAGKCGLQTSVTSEQKSFKKLLTNSQNRDIITTKDKEKENS